MANVEGLDKKIPFFFPLTIIRSLSFKIKTRKKREENSHSHMKVIFTVSYTDSSTSPIGRSSDF